MIKFDWLLFDLPYFLSSSASAMQIRKPVYDCMVSNEVFML